MNRRKGAYRALRAKYDSESPSQPRLRTHHIRFIHYLKCWACHLSAHISRFIHATHCRFHLPHFGFHGVLPRSSEKDQFVPSEASRPPMTLQHPPEPNQARRMLWTLSLASRSCSLSSPDATAVELRWMAGIKTTRPLLSPYWLDDGHRIALKLQM